MERQKLQVQGGQKLPNLRFLFRRRSTPLLGLDLGSSSVKLVELGRDARGALALERCAAEPLAPGWITDGNIEQFDEVAQAVRRAVRRSGTRTRNAALALPPSAVITRKIVLPGGLSEPELESQVEQHIPFPLDEVCLDFCVTGPSAASAGEVEVLIAASRKEKVQDRQGLAEAAGLKAVIVDIESHASRLAATRWLRRLPGRGRDTVAALFEVGAAASRMQVLHNRALLYERDQVLGSDPGADAASLSQDIGRALQLFFASTPHHHVDRVLLAGAWASLPGLAQAVTRQTALPCQLVNPFDGMAAAGGMHASEAPSCLTACGLAMRRFSP
jgi:type IV pilus assembly protein PilM